MELLLRSADFRFAGTELRAHRLNHTSQQNIDLVLSVTEVTALDVVVSLLAPATGRRVQLEWPQEVGGVFEVWPDGEDLVNQVLDALDVGATAQFPLDGEVVGDWNALALVLRS